MDDRFLKDQRRDPDPAFARGLRARLRHIEQNEPPHVARYRLPLLAAAAALAVVGALIVSPGLRLRAQALLDLFRVREIAVVQVDKARVEQLKARDFDPAALFVSDSRQAIEHEPAQTFTNVEAAAAAAGFTPQRPVLLPRGLSPDTVFVHRGGRASGRVDTHALRELMNAFDVRDLEVPAALDGQSFTVEMPVVLAQAYRSSGNAHAMLIQCASPEVSLPRGVDPARLGEIGLRLLGLPRDEAHRLALAIDWRSTLVVPVLASATSFQQVTVNGEHGMCVETTGTGEGAGPHDRYGTAVLWTHAGRVYALTGNMGRIDLMQMAESVR